MEKRQEESLVWLDWAKELQFIAQAGLTYSKDPFDLERFQRIREIKGGSFRPNIETQGSAYFALDELPPLSEDKVTREQIVLCFEAVQADDWVVPFD